MSADKLTIIEGGLPPVIERALSVAAEGLPVFPCRANKQPACKHGFLEASRDARTITRLFAAPGAVLIGVPTGPASGFMTVDIDPDGAAWREENHHRLPTTREHATRRGAHLLFQYPAGKKVKSTNGAVAPGVDIKADGGYIIWWPACGGQIVCEGPAAQLPDWLLEDANNARRKHDNDGPVFAGARNDAMASEAGRLRHYNVPEKEAWDSLVALNNERCTPPLADSELKKIFDSVWQYPPGYFATDQGNADRLIDAYGAQLRFVKQSQRWLHWNGTRFIEDNTHRTEQLVRDLVRRMHLDAVAMPDGDARKAALRWATISEGRERANAALASVPRPGITVQQTELDSDPWLLSTPEAIIDLRSGQPVRATQSQLITKATRAAYDPDERCPQWLQCLERWLPDAADRAFIKRFAGYALTGDTSEQCLLLVFGESATGKTTFLETLLHVWGDYAKRTPAATWLAKRGDTIPNDVAALAGCRVVISTESERSANWAQSLLKAATGEETLSARFMRGEWFSFLPQFKPMFGTNFLPGYDGSDKAMTRRLRPVRFDAVVPHSERDKRLQKKLRTEGPGILNWALEGCLEWQRDGLGEPPSVIKEAREYAAANDQVATFIVECCEEGKLHHAMGSDLHTAFKRWCDLHNERGLAGRQFGEALAKRGFERHHTKHGKQWLGIRLRPVAPRRQEGGPDEPPTQGANPDEPLDY